MISRLSKNIIYNLSGQGLLLVLSFVAVKYIFVNLGKDALGILFFATFMSVVLSRILEMGISFTIVREVSAHFNDNRGYIRDLIKTASLFYWSIYLLLAFGIIWLAPLIVEKWVSLGTMETATVIKVLRILGVGMLLALPKSLYGSLLYGLQRMGFNNVIDLMIVGLQQLGTIVILHLGGGLIQVAWWLVACFIFGILAYFLVCLRFFSLQCFLPGFSLKIIKHNINYTSKMMPLSILAVVHTESDKTIVSKLLPIGTFGYYNFSSNVARLGNILANVASQTAFPSFSSLFKSGDRINLMRQYRKLQDVVCLGAIPLFAIVIFTALPLFTYVFNQETAQLLLLPIILLSVGFWMNGTISVPYFFSLALGKPEISVRTNTLALFLILPMTALLIYLFGLRGAAFSWILYGLFSYFYFVPKVCSQCLKIPVGVWYWHILRIFVLAGMTYGLAWIAMGFADRYLISFLALAYSAASIAFLIGAYWMIGDELRLTLMRFQRTVSSELQRYYKHIIPNLFKSFREKDPKVRNRTTNSPGEGSIDK